VGARIPPGEWAVLGATCLSPLYSIGGEYCCRKRADLVNIDMQFGMKTSGPKEPQVGWRSGSHREKGEFWGHGWLFLLFKCIATARSIRTAMCTLQGVIGKSGTYIIFAYQYISLELRVQTSPNLLCVLPVVFVWFFSGGVAICYVLLV